MRLTVPSPPRPDHTGGDARCRSRRSQLMASCLLVSTIAIFLRLKRRLCITINVGWFGADFKHT
jgi:hypothetical protein